MRASWLIIAVATWPLVQPAACQQAPCTEAQTRRAEVEAVNLRNWDALYRSYKRYARCNDVDAAEGYSESVARILVDHWNTLPRLAKLGAGDSSFRRFVLSHVDATLNMIDVESIREKAKSACPEGLHSLCADLKKQADAAIKEDSDAHQKK
jgi:hypothetical protein